MGGARDGGRGLWVRGDVVVGGGGGEGNHTPLAIPQPQRLFKGELISKIAIDFLSLS